MSINNIKVSREKKENKQPAKTFYRPRAKLTKT